MKKYMTKMGQKTGTLKQSKKVEKTAISVEITVCSQNLNSGSLLMKGLNSSLLLVGKAGPSSSSSDSDISKDGSILGERKAINRLR